MEFYELRCRAGLLNKHVADLFKVSIPTVKRWNQTQAPHYATERLQLMAGIHPNLYGVELRNNKLVIVETRYSINLEHLKMIQYRENLLESLLINVKNNSIEQSEIRSLMQPSNDEFAINVYQSLPR